MLNHSEDDLDRVFHALADPTRRRLLEQLAAGPTSVSALAQPLSMSLPAVVQHLQVLEAASLIRTEKVGRVRTCQIDGAAAAAASAWLARLRAEWEARFERLEAYLQEMDDE